ncbi:MAG: hypothetical protein JXB19_02590 [Bacteroidales bacterium]|nr:hypothetical protein [Bacteroidales bacterium]
MKKIEILEYLQEKGYDIGYTTVCNTIIEKEAKRKEAFIRQKYHPGGVCEFDWGEVKLEVEGQWQTLYMAVFTPAMSNYHYAMLFHRQDTTSPVLSGFWPLKKITVCQQNIYAFHI